MDRFPIIYTFGSILDYGTGLLVGVLIGGAFVWALMWFCNWLDIQTLKALHQKQLEAVGELIRSTVRDSKDTLRGLE